MRYTIDVVRRALNRAWFVMMLIIVLYVLAAWTYSIFEADASMGDGLWWAVVTGTTTGYGDYFPVTVAGRFMGATYMGLMFFLNNFLLAHIIAVIMEDKNLFSHKEQEQLEALVVLMAVQNGILPQGTTSYPTVEWLKERGMELKDDSSAT